MNSNKLFDRFTARSSRIHVTICSAVAQWRYYRVASNFNIVNALMVIVWRLRAARQISSVFFWWDFPCFLGIQESAISATCCLLCVDRKLKPFGDFSFSASNARSPVRSRDRECLSSGLLEFIWPCRFRIFAPLSYGSSAVAPQALSLSGRFCTTRMKWS